MQDQKWKRQKENLIEKNKRIGELLRLKKVPLHLLAWKEPKLGLDTGDCYPLVDVLERIAELVGAKPEPKKKPGRPKKG